ncbi:unannotated protein [freshwater metagenome]|uniref:Unannotated protein n=1 Tax=freshwater metagenome TaxID=449393 RepID=A0A6J7JAH1_9ZZZZ
MTARLSEVCRARKVAEHHGLLRCGSSHQDASGEISNADKSTWHTPGRDTTPGKSEWGKNC